MTQKYSVMLSDAIEESGLKLTKIAEKVGEICGNKPTMHYLSRLKNGRNPPAGDDLNVALAMVLGIDSTELRAAAFREKIPNDVLQKLVESPSINTA